MKLTDENPDEMDCRPINPDTGIRGPEWLEKMTADRKVAAIYSDEVPDSLASDRAEGHKPAG